MEGLKSVICDLCGRRLRNRDGLTSHKKHIHGKQKVLENHTKCQECSLDLYKIERLREHLVAVHNMEMDIENRAFLSLEDFYVWKISYERQNNCSYVTKKKNNNPNEFLYLFDCSRSGVYKNKRETTKRTLKSQGTKKIGFTCTSTIKLTKIDDIYCVRFCKTHYGHDIEIKHANISVVDRQEIADMLTQGLSVDDIMEKYKNNVDDKAQRINLLTRKDIRNIAALFNIKLKTKSKLKKPLEIPMMDEIQEFQEQQEIQEMQEAQEINQTSNVIIQTEDGYTHTYLLLQDFSNNIIIEESTELNQSEQVDNDEID